MRILLAGATWPELHIPDNLRKTGAEGDILHFTDTTDTNHYTFVATGVGQVSTTLMLSKLTGRHSFDLAINLGIAGSFRNDLTPGSMVQVVQDCFADLGAEDDKDFISISKLKLPVAGAAHFSDGWIQSTGPVLPFLSDLPKTRGITVNTVHGSEATINRTIHLFNPEVESMEGAAFFLVMADAGIPALQYRAISNYVTKRNKESWKVEEALSALNNFAVSLLHHFAIFAS